MRAVIGLSSALMLVTTLSASAATMTDLVTFSANTFQASGGSPALSPPTDPVTGSFTITYDPALTYADTTSGIALNTLNISLGSSLSFNYSPSSQTVDGVTYAAHELVVGGISDGAGQILLPSNDFWLFVNTFPTSPTFNQVGYSTASSNTNAFFTLDGTGSVTVTPEITPTPLPATLPLFAGGLGVVGYLTRRKRRSQVLAAA